MIKNNILCLRDYRIIKILINGKNPIENINILQMSESEIKYRLKKIKSIIPQLYKLESVKCKEM